MKSEKIEIRVSPEEKEMIRKEAEKVGLPISRYLVMLAILDRDLKKS